MKKSTRIVKRLLALFLVVLMSINTFAAVVGDNDGAAFITKAEFDSLKNDFQNQLDRYNSSIDNKIDGAIASYLAGITIGKTEDKTLKYQDWKGVTFLNFSPSNVCSLPDYDVALSSSYYVYISGTGSALPPTESVMLTLAFNNTRTTLQNKRCLADGDAEDSTSMPNQVIWEGRATNLIEKFIGNAAFMFFKTLPNPTGDTTGKFVPYLYGATETWVHFFGCGLTKIKPGYYADNFDHITNKTWWPRFYYYSDQNVNNSKGYLDGDHTSANANSFSLSWSGALRNDGDGKTKDYEHIINYDDVEFPQLTDLDWTHTLRTLTDAPTFDDLKNTGTKSSKILWTERPGGATDLRVPTSIKTCDNYYSNDYNVANTEKVLGIGVINKIYSSEDILQTKNKEIFDISSNDSITAPKALNLYEGFPLFASDVGSQIEWTPVFNNTKVDGSSQDFELNIMLALEPFGEADNVSADKIIKINGSTNNYVTTSSKTCKIKFTMPERGIVYMKAWPTDSTILTKKWEATLDLTSCGHYFETK